MTEVKEILRLWLRETGKKRIAARRRCAVLAESVDDLLETLRHARLDHTHEAELRKRLAVDLLVIDDFGIEAMTAEEMGWSNYREPHREPPSWPATAAWLPARFRRPKTRRQASIAGPSRG